MKSIIDKRIAGMASLELVLIAPLILFLLMAFWHFFSLNLTLQSREIELQDRAKRELRKRELSLPLLKRPCLIHPKICGGKER